MAEFASAQKDGVATVALMFPGQGSQKVGMGAQLREQYSAAREVFDEADEVLGFGIAELCASGPEPELIRTENLQPALFVVSMAALRALDTHVEFSPACALGHSLGEYSALAAAGAMTFADALRAVRRRGELMASAVGESEGGMAAVIGLEADVIEEVCRTQANGDVLTIANLNSPGQIVISGHARALERAEPAFKRAGARALIRLKVSAPFHCSLMGPAAAGLGQALADLPISSPRYPVLSNVTGEPHTEPEDIRRLLVDQLVSPVRWIECVQWVLRAGVGRFLEFGPGRVLAGLLKRIDRSVPCLEVATPDAFVKVADFIQPEEAP